MAQGGLRWPYSPVTDWLSNDKCPRFIGWFTKHLLVKLPADHWFTHTCSNSGHLRVVSGQFSSVFSGPDALANLRAKGDKISTQNRMSL